MTDTTEKSYLLWGIPIFTALILIAAGLMLYAFQDNAGAVILTLSAATVLLIIFGERFALDTWLEAHGIPAREAVVPLMAMGIAIALGAVHLETIPKVFAAKVDIIAFILAFAVVSEGIGKSGYFSFAANKIVEKCQGRTSRLILYMYILSSVMAYFTTNDVVVLVLTPTIISICVHAGIRNTRLLLMSQFVAANTMSMGLLTGSPTNIILGKELHINFFQHLGLMFVPAVLTGMLSLIVIDWVCHQSRSGGLFAKRWAFADTYRVPAYVKTAQFTGIMQRWLILFGLAVALLALVTGLEWSLFFAAVPIAATSFYFLYKEAVDETGSPADATRQIGKLIKFLPYSVFFFAMCFFIFAAELAHLDYVKNTMLPFVRQHVFDDLVHTSLGVIFATGLIVNMINDLPAAALLTELLSQMEATGGKLDDYVRATIVQSYLVGLNIGCYVTPIGALAGIMWFNIIKREQRRQRELLHSAGSASAAADMELPTRGDLLRFGFMHFIFAAVILGYIVPFLIQMADLLIASPSQSEDSQVGRLISIRAYLPYIGMGLFVFIILSCRGVLRRAGVLLAHMRDVFVVLTRLIIWSMTNRGAYFFVVSMILLAAVSGLLYWSEVTHDRIYGVPEGAKPLFDSLSSFILWIMVFTGTGLQDDLKPHSTLGLALTGIVPLMIIGGIVLMTQLSSGKSILQLSKRLAKGDIPSYRIVIINYHERFESFVRTALYTRDASILLLCEPARFDQTVAFCEMVNNTAHGTHRVYAAIKHPDAFHNFQEYRIEKADEIYLFSDMTTQGEYEKLRYVAKLDALLNAARAAAEEAVTASPSGGHPTGHETGQNVAELAGMPRIFIETPSERFYELLRRSSSPLLLRTAIRMTFDNDVRDFLMADMDEDIDHLNSYYRTGRPPENPAVFVNGINPMQKIALKSYALDKQGKELFCRHFSGLRHAEAEGVPDDKRALRQLSTRVRATVSLGTKGARYMDGKEAKEIDYVRLMGLIMKVGHSHMHIGIPSAALSMQVVNAERIILREPCVGNKPVKTPKPRISPEEKVFIFNFTPHSRAFIYGLMDAFGEPDTPRVVIMAPPAQIIPDDIAEHPAVHVLRAPRPEDLMVHICPAGMTAASGGHGKFKPLLRPGDRLYVFLDFDQSNPESSSIDFIDRLDTQLHLLEEEAAAKHKKPAVSHPEIYIAVETSGPESRVLFENFFLDKIIDTSLPRQSYMKVLSMVFHRAFADKTLTGTAHGSISHFHQAAEIAACLCRYIVTLAEDLTLKDHAGSEIRVVGKTFAQAFLEIQAYSMPPMQLAARVRLVPVSEMHGKHVHHTFRLQEVLEHEPVSEGDILLNIPML